MRYIENKCMHWHYSTTFKIKLMLRKILGYILEMANSSDEHDKLNGCGQVTVTVAIEVNQLNR